MYNFCTLFDANYLSRGLAMYESLRKTGIEFHLYLFPFDETAYTVLSRLALPHVTLVRQEEFEDQALLAVKATRTNAEYCWTATSSTILFVLERYNVGHCTYIDADLFFYRSPAVLIDEMGVHSVLITEHRYSRAYRHLAPLTGTYCVQFITFRNDERGLTALRWWRGACLDWCYNRAEDGKFGDQKYLDDWPSRFAGVHVLEHLGGGLAPWNVQQYRFSGATGGISGVERASGKEVDPVFYHFHYVRIYAEGMIDFGDFVLSRSVKELFYRPYLARLAEAKRAIMSVGAGIDPHGPRQMPHGWKHPLTNLKRRWRRQYNVYPIDHWMHTA